MMLMRAVGLALTCCVAIAGCTAMPGDLAKAGDPQGVQAAAPGRPGCRRTTPAENASGAQATNAARRSAGLPPVRANMLLAEVAAQHACDMARRGVMTHRGSNSSGPGPRVKAGGYQTRLTAENIAAGPFDLPRVLCEWNGSRGHRDNIMLPQVRDYGIGQAVSEDGRTRFWAAIYAAPR